ncbi:MAG: hypothetical protein QW331_03770 [Candidatus Woesearchaeota archaeon]
MTIQLKVNCQRCGTKLRSYSPLRKWCVDCRVRLNIERQKKKKLLLRRRVARA